MQQARTQTRDVIECSDPSAPQSRLIRFFRADDPFDDVEIFALTGHEHWLLGRIDVGPSVAAPAANIGSRADATMSTRHALISVGRDGWSIVDAGSKNGTFVNHARVREPVLLRDGDIVECGHSFFMYRDRPRAQEPRVREPSHGVCLALPPLHYQIDPLLPFASSDLSLHLQGETGSGKEVVARAIHALSGRRGAFVARNCAAIPENLFEAELFGYCRGAFSGAASSELGQIRAADGGTLFLDEIGELPLPLQAKLLRTLELKEVLPLGARTPVRVDFRLVSATLCDLEASVRAGRFRQDLYGRLGRTFVVPSLREHKEELGHVIRCVLARQLTERLQPAKPNPCVCFTLGAAQALVYHDWPYNVREVKHCIESALVSALNGARDPSQCVVELSHLSLSGGDARLSAAAPEAVPAERAQRALRDQDLLLALRDAQGNRAQAARLLGVSERTVFRRIRKLRERD